MSKQLFQDYINHTVEINPDLRITIKWEQTKLVLHIQNDPRQRKERYLPSGKFETIRKLDPEVRV